MAITSGYTFLKSSLKRCRMRNTVIRSASVNRGDAAPAARFADEGFTAAVRCRSKRMISVSLSSGSK
jgi:hypothetical protein